MYDRLFELLFAILLDRLFQLYPAAQVMTWLKHSATMFGLENYKFQQALLPFLKRNDSENAILSEALYLLKAAGYEGKQIIRFAKRPASTVNYRIRQHLKGQRHVPCQCSVEDIQTIKQFLDGLRALTGGIL